VTSRCQDIQPLLSLYLDRNLDPEARATVAAHLSECAVCSGLLRDLEQVRGGSSQECQQLRDALSGLRVLSREIVQV
jgi:predicted anti-sigma-YlaC factor YlaD